MMDRLLVVRCPGLLEEDEGGATLRTFVSVLAAVEAYCPGSRPSGPASARCPLEGRPGTSGASRHWSTWSPRPPQPSPMPRWASPTACSVPCWPPGPRWWSRPGPPRRSSPPCRCPPSGTPTWPSCWPGSGSAPSGTSPPSPSATSSDGSAPTAPTPPGGPGRRAGSSPGSANPGSTAASRGDQHGGRRPRRPRAASGAAPATAMPGRPGPWPTCSELLGADGVLRIRLQGGRSPAERSRLVTWREHGRPPATGPWTRPGPARSRRRPRRSCTPLRSGPRWSTTPANRWWCRGGACSPPRPERLSVDGGPWTAVTGVGRAVAGRGAVVVTGPATNGPDAGRAGRRGCPALLTEQGRWWVEATYG